MDMYRGWIYGYVQEKDIWICREGIDKWICSMYRGWIYGYLEEGYIQGMDIWICIGEGYGYMIGRDI